MAAGDSAGNHRLMKFRCPCPVGYRGRDAGTPPNVRQNALERRRSAELSGGTGRGILEGG